MGNKAKFFNKGKSFTTQKQYKRITFVLSVVPRFNNHTVMFQNSIHPTTGLFFVRSYRMYCKRTSDFWHFCRNWHKKGSLHKWTQQGNGGGDRPAEDCVRHARVSLSWKIESFSVFLFDLKKWTKMTSKSISKMQLNATTKRLTDFAKLNLENKNLDLVLGFRQFPQLPQLP